MNFYKAVVDAAKETDGEFVTVNAGALKDFIEAAERGFIAYRNRLISSKDEPAFCKSCSDDRFIDLPVVIKKRGDGSENAEFYSMPCPDCRTGIRFQIDGHKGDFELFVKGRDEDSVTYDAMHGLQKIMTITFGGRSFDESDVQRIEAISKQRTAHFLAASGHTKDAPDELPAK